jgi:hypothetical protein
MPETERPHFAGLALRRNPGRIFSDRTARLLRPRCSHRQRCRRAHVVIAAQGLEHVVAGSELVFRRRLAPDGREAWKQVIERGYESYLAKDERSVCEGGATRQWLKLKQKGWTVAEAVGLGWIFRPYDDRPVLTEDPIGYYEPQESFLGRHRERPPVVVEPAARLLQLMVDRERRPRSVGEHPAVQRTQLPRATPPARGRAAGPAAAGGVMTATIDEPRYIPRDVALRCALESR